MANLSDHLVNYQSNDTLDSVTSRGATTTNGLTIGNLTSTGIDDNATTIAITIDSSGNVGIGANTPGAELHVKGTSTVAKFEGTGGSGFISISDSDDGTIAFIGVDGGNLKFQTSGSSYSDKLVIDTAGNVGIGTGSSIESNLHIKGPSNTQTSLQLESATSQYAPNLLFDGTVGAVSDYLLGTIDASWDTHTNVVSSIRFESGSDTTNKDDGMITFWTSSSGPSVTERMRIDSTGRILIGTSTSPSVSSPHLVIKNPNNTSAYMQMTGSGDTGGILLGTNPDRSLVLYSYSGATGSESYGSPYMIMNGGGTSTPGSLQLGYDTAYPIRVDSNTFVYYPHSNTAHVAYYKRQTHPANSNEYHYYWRTSDTGWPGGANETTHMTLNTGSTNGGKLYLPGGVSFDGSFAAAHTLDDYEEGSWTPQLHDGTNTINLTGNHYYRKIGALVVATCSAYNFGITGLNTSHLRIQNLPFTASSQNNSAAIGRASSTTEPTVFMEVSNNSNFGYLYGKGSNSGANVLSYVKTYFQSASVASIWMTITYLSIP